MVFNNNEKMEMPESREVKDLQRSSKKRKKRKFRSRNTISIKTTRFLSILLGTVIVLASSALVIYLINFLIQVYISD